MASNPLLNFDNVGPDTSQVKSQENNLTSFDDIGPNTKTFSITSEGDPRYDRNETADISSIGPGDFDGNKSWFDAFAYGAKLGFTDTFRGGKQMLGIDVEGMKTDQQELYARMQDEDYGFWTTAGYFGGAILDPITWIFPFAKAKTVYQMAKMGAISGGFFGATGYVDEDSILDSRVKQAGAGLVGGTIIAPAIGQASKLFRKKKLPTGVLPEGDISVRTLNEEALKDIKLLGAMGEGPRTIKVRTEKELKTVIDNATPLNLRDTPTGKEKAAYNQLKGARFFINNYLTQPYQEKFGKPALQFFKGERGQTTFGGKLASSVGGTEVASGLAGAAIAPQYLEDDASLMNKFSAAAIGFMSTAVGIGGIKQIPVTRTMLKGTDVEYDKKVSFGEMLARGIKDDYGLPADLKAAKNASRGFENKLADRFGQLAAKIEPLSTDEQRLLLNLFEADTTYGKIPNQLKLINKEFREEATKVGQMMVDYGLISERTFKQNVLTYLRRTYTSDQSLAKIGDELKPRGFHIQVPKKEFVKYYSKDKAFQIDAGNDNKLVRQFQKIRTEEQYKIGTKEYNKLLDQLKNKTRIKGHKGWEIFSLGPGSGKKLSDAQRKELEFGNPKGQAYKRAFTKLKDDDVLTIRWQLNKQERIALGQIENASLAMAETGRLLSGNLGRNHYYNQIAKSGYAVDRPGRAQIQLENLIKIPDTTIAKSANKKVYGNLAGKFLPEEIADNIVRTHNYITRKPSDFYKRYRSLNQLWKVSKTAFNPTVHINNTLSNVILYDLVDGKNLRENLSIGHKALMAAGRNEKSELYTLAKNYNVLDSDLVTQELKEITKFLKTDPYAKIKIKDDEFNQAVTVGGVIFNDLKNSAFGIKTAADSMLKLYRYEDQVFRMALFRDRLAKGFSVEKAAADAKRSFVDYDINAPLINTMRNSVTPFLAYTYRIVPLLGETAVLRPWKYAKYMGLGYGLNAAGGYFAGGDEEAERALFSKGKEGNIFGLPGFPSKSIKMPVNINDKPVYLDITRFIPGGDVLDIGTYSYMEKIPGVPAPLQPSFGLLGDTVPAIFGYDLFSGRKMKGLGDSLVDEYSIRGKQIIQNLTPNFPFFPGSYTTQAIERARKATPGTSPYSVDRTEAGVLLRGFGFKYDVADIEKLAASKNIEFSKKIRANQEKISNLVKDLNTNKIDEEQFIKKVRKIEDRIIKISEQFDVRLNKAASLFREEPKEFIPGFLAIPGELGLPGFPEYDEVKDQTDKLFNKN
jgi:hypothetical protein